MNPAEHQQQVKQCVGEISSALPALAQRHTPLIVIAALTEHVSGALAIGRDDNTYTEEFSRAIVERVKELVFPDPTAEKP
jgi:hypothetical protein